METVRVSPATFHEASTRVVLAHPSGNQFFRHLAKALHEADLLAELCTSVDWRTTSALAKLLPRGIAAELGRRDFSTALGVPVVQHPWRELMRLAASRVGWSALTHHERGVFSVDAVYREFDAWMARRLGRQRQAGIVYAYEDAAEATFRAAKALGWRKVYDLPIAYGPVTRRLLDEEAERWPEWEPTLVGTRDSAEKYERKAHELALADLVICPSRFVAESLPPETRAQCPVIVAPFGSPPVLGRKPPTDPTQPLRVLFAGSMTQRKGLADLFAALRLLQRKDIVLVVLGSPVTDLAFYRRQYRDFEYAAPRPHAEVLAFMGTCDVLCLPSVVEGRALVVQEAMSAGLPAIVTENTGAADVIEMGRNGFVVPMRSPQALAEKLAWFADHRTALPEWAVSAQAAAQRFTWEQYGATIVAALRT